MNNPVTLYSYQTRYGKRLRPDIAIGRIVSSVPARFTDAPWGLLRQDELMKTFS